MLKKVACNLCKSDNTAVIFKSTVNSSTENNPGYACTTSGHGIHYQVVKCRNCGLSYSSPRPDATILEKEYKEVKDEIYQEELTGRIKTFQRNLKKIDCYKKNGKLLDIGCSLGVFLSLAKKDGWEIFGIEPSGWCVEQCKKLFNIDIQQGTNRDLAKFNRKFDVITMWDVLEHVDNPLETLINCRDALKDGGILAFSTLDIGSLYAKFFGKKWPWLLKMHIYYFDRKTIKKYLEKVGLKLLELNTYKHTISINYLLYKLKKINLFLHHLIRLFKKIIFFNKNIYITFDMGDFVEVYAKKI